MGTRGGSAYNRMLRAGEQEADIQQALVEFRSIGERWGISYALATLADLSARRGDLGVALDYGEQAADVLAELGAVEDLVFLKAREAQLRWLVGDETGSAAAMAQAEEDAASVGWPDAVGDGLLQGQIWLAGPVTARRHALNWPMPKPSLVAPARTRCSGR